MKRLDIHKKDTIFIQYAGNTLILAIYNSIMDTSFPIMWIPMKNTYHTGHLGLIKGKIFLTYVYFNIDKWVKYWGIPNFPNLLLVASKYF